MNLTALREPEYLQPAAGLHLREKDAYHLIPVRVAEKKGKIPGLMSFRMGIHRWMKPCRKSPARKKAVRYPMTNAIQGGNPDRIIRFFRG